MPQILWATDVHLDSAELHTVESFCASVNRRSALALLLGGDIADGPAAVYKWLGFLADRIDVPIYFVLGNHDFYGSSIEDVRQKMRWLRDPRIQWLPHAGVVDLVDGVTLVGQDGWGDARLGRFFESHVVLNDYLAIEELSQAFDLDTFDGDLRNQGELKDVLAGLGEDEANSLRPVLATAVDRSRQVVVLTHVPPFHEACWYHGGLSDDFWLPGFTCKAMGDLLLEIAEANPNCNITVFCGHTHGNGVADISRNLTVYTGEAAYGQVGFREVEVDARRVAAV